MFRNYRLALLLLAALCLGIPNPSVAQADESPVQLELRHRMEALQAHGRLTVDGVRITATRLIADLYPQSRFQPAWTDQSKVDDLLRAIADIHLDGMDPQDYYLDRLKRLRGELGAPPDVGKQVDLDILMTDALARLAYNAFFGKVDPERIDPDINATLGFDQLSREVRIPKKSIMRMLSNSGNPTTRNMVLILAHLNKHEGLRPRVSR